MPCAEQALGDWQLTGGPLEAPIPATVPGTVAGALRDAGIELDGLDDHAWTFLCPFDAPAQQGERLVLRFDGLATLATVALNGETLLRSESMWEPHAVDVTGRLREAGNLLEISFDALSPVVRKPRKPRARWRTQLVAGGLRFQRTMLLGRIPGMAPGPACVGPWRPVVLERRLGVVVSDVRLRPGDGVLAIDAAVEGAEEVEVGCAGATATLPVSDGRVSGELEVGVAVGRWWPHTHGEPMLHDVTIAGQPAGRAGFRTLEAPADVEAEGLRLTINGAEVFARGAVWVPVDLVGMAPPAEEVRATLVALRDMGMNLVRVVGTASYEDAVFHDLCDELGILVWQDLMLANLDYPLSDDGFRATIEAEVAREIGALAGRPSLVAVCGGSEVDQQVAMLGLDPGLARENGELIAAMVAALGADAAWIRNAPVGGELPFRADAGVANWFGVGGYQQPVSAARRAGVLFASECLAFANVPGEEVVEAVGIDGGVARDAGVAWTFGDVRDHYLHDVYGQDPQLLRRTDPERYLALSRMLTGELMAEVMGEWRRAASPCAGAIVLWLRDLQPGSGWGLLDAHGTPKLAAHVLGRALRPVAVWTTDEGSNGIAIHAGNDSAEAIDARLRVTLLADGAHVVEQQETGLALPARSVVERSAQGVLGRFVDVNWTYRFGPPQHDAVVVSLLREDGELLSETVRFPQGRPLEPRTAAELGLEARVADGTLEITTERLLSGLRIHGAPAAPQGLDLPPGTRSFPAGDGAVQLSALNLRGRLAAARAQ